MINITSIWHACHVHLKPLREYLPLKKDQYHICPICSFGQAFHIAVRICFGQTIWVEGVKVLYCQDCQNFMIDAHEQTAIQARNPEVAGLEVTDVEARIWSPMPTFLNVEPTTRCNFNCWYCIGRHMKQADISVEDFSRILDHTPSITAIGLVGEGEPLMHKGFFDMARMAADRGKKVLITTNGSTLSVSNVKKLCESGVTYVSISIDATNPEVFATSRIDGSLAQVLKGIERLRRFRDENGYVYPKIAIKGTLFDYSEHELLSIVDLAKSHGVEIFESFQALNPKQSYVDIYPVAHASQLHSVGRVLHAIASHSLMAKNKLQPFEDFALVEGIEYGGAGKNNGIRQNCDERYIYSLLSGDVTPCCQIKEPIDHKWNLIEEPLSEIYEDAHYENIRFNLWNGIFPNYCKGCIKTR